MPPTPPAELAQRSVVDHPRAEEGFGQSYQIILSLGQFSDSLPIWGTTPGLRDQKLREFWPSEPYFSSALYSTVARYASFGWTLQGPPLTTSAVQRLLHSSEFGEGWITFMSKILVDLYTQDNGAFIEVVRTADSPSAAPIGLNHLDSAACYRTGNPETPVIFYDTKGRGHRLKWYQVVPLAEFPSPNRLHNGRQICALSRVLKAAQIMREILTYKDEKVSGRFAKAIHLVSGMPTRLIEDALKKHESNADAQGLMRMVMPAILGTLDPNATVSHAQIDLASLPDNFDEDKTSQWYITMLAMAFGTDYQDFAPSPGRGIGSGTESKTSHVKSRGKGPAVFMRTIEQAFNFRGVLPSTVRFSYGEQDLGEQFDKLVIKKERALVLELLTKNGIITNEVARQIMVDEGDLDSRYLTMMREQNATAEVELTSSLPPIPESPVKPGLPGPDEPPSAKAPNPPENNNVERTPPTQATKRPAVAA